jgi:diguanylate cyclase (GGDEF)-like protein
LPYFIKKNDITKEQLLLVEKDCVKTEVVRSTFIAIVMLILMIIYMIIGGCYNFFFNGKKYGLIFFSAALLLIVISALLILFNIINIDRNISVDKRQTVQFVFYFFILVGVMMFFVETQLRNPKEFSLSFMRLIALTITASTRLWSLITLDIVGTALTTFCLIYYPISAAFAIQYVAVLIVFLFGSYFVRSNNFFSCYYKDKANWQSNKNLLLSITDNLTGVSNRRALDITFSSKTFGWQLRKSKITIIMFDVDFFKIYNDTFGHLSGDNCLKNVIKAISPLTNKGNVDIYRFGGDEFIILLKEPDTKVILKFIIDLLNAVRNAKIEAPKYLKNKYLTISVGASSVEVDEKYSYINHINEADRNLYEAKENNKGGAYYDGEKVDENILK